MYVDAVEITPVKTAMTAIQLAFNNTVSLMAADAFSRQSVNTDNATVATIDHVSPTFKLLMPASPPVANKSV